MVFVDMPIDDPHSLQIFLNEFLADHLDVLFRLSAGPFPDPVGGVLLDQHPNLFREIRSRGQLRDPLADQLAFGEVALAVTDENALLAMIFQLVRWPGGWRRGGWVGSGGGSLARHGALFFDALERFVGMLLNDDRIRVRILSQSDSTDGRRSQGHGP